MTATGGKFDAVCLRREENESEDSRCPLYDKRMEKSH